MKNNKKVIIPLLATVAGVSIVGGISGAVAWYQYNTRANASFVGSSVAESGVLQISRDGSAWGRDAYYKQDDPGFVQSFSPVTFGYTKQVNPGDPKVIKANEVLPDNDPVGDDTIAFAYPEAGHGSYSEWTKVQPGKEFIQYTIYLKALEVNNLPDAADPMKASSKDVFLSSVILDGSKKMTSGENPTYNEEIGKALRLHLSVKQGLTTKNFLISKEGGSTTLYSNNLDLDADGHRDVVGGMAWEFNENYVEYGTKDATQESYSISEIVATKDENGDFDFTPTAAEEAAGLDEATKREKQLICTTSINEPVEITVTCWLEGWQELENLSSETSALWDPRVTGSATNFLSTLHVGMTFDIGKNAFKA